MKRPTRLVGPARGTRACPSTYSFVDARCLLAVATGPPTPSGCVWRSHRRACSTATRCSCALVRAPRLSLRDWKEHRSFTRVPPQQPFSWPTAGSSCSRRCRCHTCASSTSTAARSLPSTPPSRSCALATRWARLPRPWPRCRAPRWLPWPPPCHATFCTPAKPAVNTRVGFSRKPTCERCLCTYHATVVFACLSCRHAGTCPSMSSLRCWCTAGPCCSLRGAGTRGARSAWVCCAPRRFWHCTAPWRGEVCCLHMNACFMFRVALMMCRGATVQVVNNQQQPGACAGFQWSGRPTALVMCATCWVAGLATLVEKKSRRMELALYCLSRVRGFGRPCPLFFPCILKRASRSTCTVVATHSCSNLRHPLSVARVVCALCRGPWLDPSHRGASAPGRAALQRRRGGHHAHVQRRQRVPAAVFSQQVPQRARLYLWQLGYAMPHSVLWRMAHVTSCSGLEQGQITHNPSTNQLLTRMVSSPSLQKLSSLAHTLSLGRRRGSDSSSIGVASPRSEQGSPSRGEDTGQERGQQGGQQGGQQEGRLVRAGPSGMFSGWLDEEHAGGEVVEGLVARNEMSFGEWRARSKNGRDG